MLLTDAQRVSDIKIGDGDVVGVTFDEHGAIEIIKTWEELSVGAIYHAGDLNAGINPTIEYSTTIKPLNPNLAITQNGPEIFLGLVYKLMFHSNITHSTHVDSIGYCYTFSIITFWANKKFVNRISQIDH